jgi:hypothetical protein
MRLTATVYWMILMNGATEPSEMPVGWRNLLERDGIEVGICQRHPQSQPLVTRGPKRLSDVRPEQHASGRRHGRRAIFRVAREVEVRRGGEACVPHDRGPNVVADNWHRTIAPS